MRGTVAGTRAAAAWVRNRELMTLVGLLTLAAMAWAFVEIADEVSEGETREVEASVLLALRDADGSPAGPWWLEDMGEDITALGSVSVLTLVTLVAIGFLLLQRNRRTAVFVVVAVGGGMLLSSLLKDAFGRPRPDLVAHAVEVRTPSFPSGHSLMAGVTYLTLGALIARVQPKRRLKLYLLGVAAGVTLLVGVSRVYLGVHWPTDVLAGWTLAAAWALACWLVARLLQRRGRIDPERVENGP